MVSKLLAALAVAGVASAASGTNVAKFNAYWGQTGPSDERLRDRCDEGADYISLSFVTSSPENNPTGYPGIGFAAHCWGTAFEKDGVPSNLLNHCQTIIDDLEYCRKKGTKMLLSIGGVWNKETSDYRLTTEKNGRIFANFLWRAFGPYDASWTGPRPFDKSPTEHSQIDGFDFDLELPDVNGKHFDNKPWIAMADQFRRNDKNIIITGAPQCPTDPKWFSMQEMIQKTQFDALFIQFYNNVGCDLIPGNDPFNSHDDFNYNEWEKVIASSEKSKNAKLFVGVPAAPDPNNSQDAYVNPQALEHIICKIAKRPSFGGISIWDMWTGKNNIVNGKSFNTHVQEILTKCGLHTTTTTTTTTTSTTPSTTSTTTTTTTSSSSSSSTTTTSSSTSTPTSTTASSTSTSSSTSSQTTSSQTTSSQPTSSSSSTSSVNTSSSSETTSSTTVPTSSSSSSSSVAPTSSETSSSSSAVTTSSETSSSSSAVTTSSETSSSSAVPTSSETTSSTSSSSVPTSSSSSSSAVPTSSETSSSSSAPTTSAGSTSSETTSSSAVPTSTETTSSSSSAVPTSSETSSSSAVPTSSETTSSSAVPTSSETTSSSAVPTSTETTSSSVVPTSTETTSSSSSVVPTSSSSSSSSSVTTAPTTTSAPVTSAPWGNTTTTTDEMTTSTVFTTTTYTITSCAPTVTNCPVGHVTTETVYVSTTVCPVTKTTEAPQPTGNPGQPGEQMTTSTVYATKTFTITKCAPTVTNCPVGHVVTQTVSVSETVCPVTKTNEVPQPSNPAGGKPSGNQPSGNKPTQSMTTTTLHSTTTKTIIKTLSETGPKETPVVTPSKPAGNQCPGGPNCPAPSGGSKCPGGPNCPVGTGAPSAPIVKPTTPVVTGGASSVAAGLVALVAAQIFLL
ncbi:hypothetical protein PWT90_07978 [Aphanocladium album]|nr:hypothetical protein PWT90_07978 [Aphanocladium album]